MMTQLGIFDQPPRQKAPRTDRVASHLAQPFDREEARVVDGLYRENRKLVSYFTRKLSGRYGHCMDAVDVSSCVGVAFLKAWRAWKLEKGAFSSILWRFAEGECRHWVRDHGFAIAAPNRVRERGTRARRLLEQGDSTDAVMEQLGVTAEQLRDALQATAGMAHEQMDFQLHASHHMTPWEALEAAEVGASW